MKTTIINLAKLNTAVMSALLFTWLAHYSYQHQQHGYDKRAVDRVSELSVDEDWLTTLEVDLYKHNRKL